MIARDLNLFARLDEDGGSSKTCSQLAQTTRADPALLSMFIIGFYSPDSHGFALLSSLPTDQIVY